MMRRAMLAAALLGSLGASAVASDATWITEHYRDHTQIDITCGAGAICEVELDRGESLKGGQFVGEQIGGSEAWQHSSFIEGVPTDRGTEMRPHLTFVASSGGLWASAVVATDRHMYRFMLRSADSAQPTYVRMAYPSPPAPPKRNPTHLRSVGYAAHFHPQPAPLPMDVASQMARACASMPRSEQYGSDLEPTQWRPARVCHSSTRTFIQLASSDTVPTDVPIPREVTATGDANVVWSYDSKARIYGVDLVPNELVLTLGHGKNATRMRIQRQKAQSPAVAVRAR